MNFREFNQKARIAVRMGLNLAGVRKKKVFAVGFNKSASSSLHALFRSLGRPSFHGPRWRRLDNRLLKKYDCFSDGEPDDLTMLDRMFPGAKFILNVRDLEGWLYSRLAHIERSKRDKKGYRTGTIWDTTPAAVKTWIEKRNHHHLSVLSYFSKRPGDLLVVNFVQDKDAATKVCHFLGYKGTYQRPQKNIAATRIRPPEHREMIQNSIAELGIASHELYYDLYCPGLVGKDDPVPFPPDSRLLSKKYPTPPV